MIWFMLPFTMIGVFVVSFFVFYLLSETVRAIRQSHRVATVHIRVSTAERRRPTVREWWYCFIREFDRKYDYLTIGFINIPHNPSKPMRGAWHG
jgi:hypothetical protein